MIKEFKVAHLQEQGQDLVIIPLDGSTMSTLSTERQNGIRETLQYLAEGVGLKGTVCLVWNTGSTFHSLAPELWHPYFHSIDVNFVQANLNRTLTVTYSE